MVRYIPHHEIDKQKWDKCISDSVNRIVYGFSWYLDIICPGWDGLVEGDYDSVFPLTYNRKYLIKYLYQPYFAQQLGLFSRNLLSGKLVQDFLDAIPQKFRFVEIHLNSMNKVDVNRIQTVKRLNHELDLIHSYPDLVLNYDQNTRRNIRKAQNEDLVTGNKVDPDELISLFRENYGKQEERVKFHHYQVLRNMMEYCLKNTFSFITGIYLPDGSLCAGAFFLKDNSRLIYQLAASNLKAREKGAMFLMVDHIIRDHSGLPMILDFEGSNDKNVARFYKGFGATEISYYKVLINRLPQPWRFFYTFRKGEDPSQ